MKEILLQAKAFILPMSLIANLLLIYLINDLPQKISEAINLSEVLSKLFDNLLISEQKVRILL